MDETETETADLVIDADTELQCLGHWVKRLEKYLHVSTSSNCTTSTFEQLQCHLEVQSAIEKLVYRLADLKRRCCSSDQSTTRNCQQLTNSQSSCATSKFPSLEKRLKQCWLKSLEKQYLLESLLRENSALLQEDDLRTDGQEVSDGTYQPMQKCRRLTKDQSLHDSAGSLARSIVSSDAQRQCQSILWPAVCTLTNQYSKDLKKPFISSEPELLTTSPVDFLHSNLKARRISNKYTDLKSLDASNMLGRKYRRKSALTVNGQRCVNQDEKRDIAAPLAQPYWSTPMASECCNNRLQNMSASSDEHLFGATFHFSSAQVARQNNHDLQLHSTVNNSNCMDGMPQPAGKISSKSHTPALPVQKDVNFQCEELCQTDKSERFNELNGAVSLLGEDSNRYFTGNLSESMRILQMPKAEAMLSRTSACKADKEGKSRSVARFIGKSKRTRQASRPRGRQKNVQYSCKTRAGSQLKRHVGLDLESIFWDDYQEKLYSSEAYSETSLDETAVRRITDFGDDYSVCLAVAPAFPYMFSPTSPLGQSNGSHSSSSCHSEIQPGITIGKVDCEEAVVRPSDDTIDFADACQKEAYWTESVEDLKEMYAKCPTDSSLLTPSIEEGRGAGSVGVRLQVTGCLFAGHYLHILIDVFVDLILHCKVVGTQVISDNQCSSVGHALCQSLSDARTILGVQELLLHGKENVLLIGKSWQDAADLQKKWKEQLEMLEETKGQISQAMNQASQHARSCRKCLASFSFLMDGLRTLLGHLQDVTLSYQDRIDLWQSCSRLMRCTWHDGQSQSAEMVSLPDLVRREMQQSFLTKSTQSQHISPKPLTEAPPFGQESLASAFSPMEGSVKLVRGSGNSINADQSCSYTGTNYDLPLADASESQGQFTPQLMKNPASPSQDVKVLSLRSSREECLPAVKLTQVQAEVNGPMVCSQLVNSREKTGGNKCSPVRIIHAPRDMVRKLVLIFIMIVLSVILCGLWLVQPTCCSFSYRHWSILELLLISDWYAADRPF